MGKHYVSNMIHWFGVTNEPLLCSTHKWIKGHTLKVATWVTHSIDSGYVDNNKSFCLWIRIIVLIVSRRLVKSRCKTLDEEAGENQILMGKIILIQKQKQFNVEWDNCSSDIRDKRGLVKVVLHRSPRSPSYQFNSLNFDSKKLSVRSVEDHLKVEVSGPLTCNTITWRTYNNICGHH